MDSIIILFIHFSSSSLLRVVNIQIINGLQGVIGLSTTVSTWLPYQHLGRIYHSNEPSLLLSSALLLPYYYYYELLYVIIIIIFFYFYYSTTILTSTSHDKYDWLRTHRTHVVSKKMLVLIGMSEIGTLGPQRDEKVPM